MLLYGEWARRSEMGTDTGTPDRILMAAPELDENQLMVLAERAVYHARRLAPKLSGRSSRRFRPIVIEGHFGILWQESYIWFQEVGISAFTMHRLAGKTIPMWLDDPTGELRRKYPKADTRTTADGRTQVLQFRKVAKHGERKDVKRRRGGKDVMVSVPASYPGAPGRIAQRRPDGTIAPGNVGVRWRHSGMQPKGFLYDGLTLAAFEAGIPIRDVIATNERWT